MKVPIRVFQTTALYCKQQIAGKQTSARYSELSLKKQICKVLSETKRRFLKKFAELLS